MRLSESTSITEKFLCACAKVVDVIFLEYSVTKILATRGRTVMLLFAFEYIIQVAKNEYLFEF